MYKVLRVFDDLLDPRKSVKGGQIFQHYEPGEIYPRKGYSPSVGRVLELGTAANRRGEPLIELSPDMLEALKQMEATATLPAAEEESKEKETVKKRRPNKKRKSQE